MTIPKKLLEKSGLKIGSPVNIEFEEKGHRFVIEQPVTVKEELFEWTKGFIHEYRQALEELAKK